MVIRILLIFPIYLSLLHIEAQTLDEVYTSWAEREIPVAHENIVKMVNILWPDNLQKAAPLVEAHCKALNRLLTEGQQGSLQAEQFQKALEKWSRAKENERKPEWWEWPDTNWIRVEVEYKQLLKSD